MNPCTKSYAVQSPFRSVTVYGSLSIAWIFTHSF